MENLIGILAVIAIGIGATAVLDLWALMLKRVFKVASLNFCLVGRWLSHMRDGVFQHQSITAAAPRHMECGIGWSVHYLIGVAFAAGLVAMAGTDWLFHPTLLPALLFGIATVVFPFLIMQPALGLGIAASKTPHPAKARLRSLTSHAVFGIGLYISALALSPFISR